MKPKNIRAGRRPVSVLGPNFLLESRPAIRLYEEYAAGLPILDYHSHLAPRDIAEDRRFENLTRIWLEGDHYKWRAMRTCGVPEARITGDAPDRAKFEQWAVVVPQTLGNPLYHWTHMELACPLGLANVQLNRDTAEWVWTEGSTRVQQPEFSVRQLLCRAKVHLVCTTDDPTDDLAEHDRLAADRTFPVHVLPTFRPDAVLQVEQPDRVNAWLDRLAGAAGMSVTDWSSLLTALEQRCDHFHARGCRLSDHGLEQPYAEDYDEDEVAETFRALRNGQTPERGRGQRLKSAILHQLGHLYHARGWTQQFHFGALRNVNTRMAARLGRDAGFDTIGDFELARPLARLLDRWDREDRLAKTILYNLNPADNEMLAAMTGNFHDGITPGKMQYGTAWWFMDQRTGIERQLDALASLGLLSRFVGMVTDSRSFLSFSRHEYFRRILCNRLGGEMARGLLPMDFDLVGGMVRDVCYDNAVRYFGFETVVTKGA